MPSGPLSGGRARRRDARSPIYIGIRRAELAGLQLADYTPQPPTLKVRGKGNKHRSVPLTQRGEIAGTSMTGRAVSKILQKWVGQAGVEPLSPHDFRRTFIGDLLERGIDISRVKEMEVLRYPYTRRRTL